MIAMIFIETFYWSGTVPAAHVTSSLGYVLPLHG